MSTAFTCIIVDDSELDRLMLRHLLGAYPTIQILGEYASAEQLLADTTHQQPDILFLDIDMGEMSGLKLRQRFMHIDVCVYITSHPEFAVDSFELNALDFIVKPLSKERLSKTILRIQEYLQMKNKACQLDKEMGTEAIFIKDGNKKIKILTHEILYLEAYKDYTKIVTDNSYNIVSCSLGNLLTQSPFDKFVRIHRSYAVASHKVQKIGSNDVSLGNIVLPIGRSYKELLPW